MFPITCANNKHFCSPLLKSFARPNALVREALLSPPFCRRGHGNSEMFHGLFQLLTLSRAQLKLSTLDSKSCVLTVFKQEENS